MAVARADGGEAGIDADVGGGLVDAEAEAGDAERGGVEGESVCQGKFGGRHACSGRGFGRCRRVVVCFCGGVALWCRLVFGGEGFVVGMEVSMDKFELENCRVGVRN